MAIDTSNRTESPRRGWAARWFGGRGGPPRVPAHTTGGATVGEAARRLVAQDRYAFVLLNEAGASINDLEAAPAWTALGDAMALIPGGPGQIVGAHGGLELLEIPAFYLDRRAVSNRQYQRFVAAGGYDDLELWPPEVWPGLMRFNDRTGQPGPAVWERGTFPAGKADHPVVGVCWHEAQAFGRWVGKRLPAAAEWQRAAGWTGQAAGAGPSRYPWGDLFDPARANLDAAGPGQTVPVHAFPTGDTPNGIRQLAGNVWEWLADPLTAIPCQPGETLHPWAPMRRIIGGAFTTYLPSEATSYFVTGQAELDRRPDIGFRLAVSADRLRPAP